MSNTVYAADDQVDAFFEHFGIKGMKWGVRRNRKQLQAARGKKDWEDAPSESNRSSSTSSRPKGSADWRNKEALSQRPISDLSNADLAKLTARLNAERNYKQAMSLYSKENRTTGQKFVAWAKDTSIDVGKDIGKDLMKKAGTAFINSQLKKRGYNVRVGGDKKK